MVFKEDIIQRERGVAKLIYNLGEAWEQMEKANKERDEEPSKRWRAHFDYLRARLAAQIAYIYEYQSMLGQLRKELPARDPNLHNGWRLASQEKLQGDKAGKDMAKEAKKIWDKIIEKYPGTPWELLAKRDRLTTLGLEWQAVRIGGER